MVDSPPQKQHPFSSSQQQLLLQFQSSGHARREMDQPRTRGRAWQMPGRATWRNRDDSTGVLHQIIAEIVTASPPDQKAGQLLLPDAARPTPSQNERFEMQRSRVSVLPFWIELQSQ